MRPPILKIQIHKSYGRERLLEFNMKCPHCEKEIVLAHDLILKRPLDEEKEKKQKERELRRKFEEYRQNFRIENLPC